MKQSLLVLATCLFTVLRSPAVPITLADYLALGPGGTTIGGAVFANFMLGPNQTGATPINPAQILVNAINVGGAPALQFVFNQIASGQRLLELSLSYTVSNASIFATSLAMAGATAAGNGAVTATVALNGITPNPGTLITFATANASQLTDQRSFGNVPFVTTLADFVIDGGGNGQGALSSATIGYSVRQVTVPDGGPTFALTTAILALCLAAPRVLRCRTLPSVSNP